MSFLLLEPMNHHSQLGKRECEKSADREERNKVVGHPAEEDQQASGNKGDPQNPVGKYESSPAFGKNMRQVIVARQI